MADPEPDCCPVAGLPGRVTHMRLDGEAWEQPLPQENEQPLNVGYHAVTSALVSMYLHAV